MKGYSRYKSRLSLREGTTPFAERKPTKRAHATLGGPSVQAEQFISGRSKAESPFAPRRDALRRAKADRETVAMLG